MLDHLRAVVTRVLGTALSVAGVRVGTEEPCYTAEALINRVQIRRYGPRIAAETTVVAAEPAARSAGCRRLAGYLFGANDRRDRIAMTGPVSTNIDGYRGELISTVGSVAETCGGESSWTVRFYLPANSTLETLPVPDDERVRLVAQPAGSLAVLRFTGTPTPKAVGAATGRLLNALWETGFTAIGVPITWLYDPPWTIPFLRRNEVAVPIDD